MRLAAVVVGTALATTALTGPAFAGDAVTWDGKHGTDSIRSCDPGESPYLHWVLTSGGNANVSHAALDVDAETVPGGRKGGSGRGALHFYTGFHDPAGIGSAVATVSGSAGSNPLLTISDGCRGRNDGGGGDGGGGGGGDGGGTVPPEPCNKVTPSGGAGVTTNVHELGRTSGTFDLSYQMYTVPDQLDLYYQGALLYSTGEPVSSDATVPITFSGTSSQVTIVVTGPPGTSWHYTVACPT